MNKENTQKLFKDFNSFFNWGQPIKENLVSGFGFECGDGWFDIIWSLCKDLRTLEILAQKDNPGYKIQVSQVKEKFGGLRFYLKSSTEAIEDRIKIAEIKSLKTCEKCGEKGKTRTKGWIYTLCDKCFSAIK